MTYPQMIARTLTLMAAAVLLITACAPTPAASPGATSTTVPESPAAAASPAASPATAASPAGQVIAKPATEYKWRMAASLSAQDPFTQRQATMLEHIKERTQGGVQVTLFAGDALMKAGDVPKAISTGTIEMESVGVAFFGGLSDIAAILSPGFVGVSTEDALRLLERDKEGRKIFDEHMATLGIKPLAFWNQTDIGFVSFDPLNTVDSMRGKKLRVSNEISAKVLQALGAEPTVMGGSEAVDAMRRRIIDGSTCQPTCSISRGYGEFSKYYTPWTVVPFLGMVSMNLRVWNSLPADVQKVIQEEADAAGKDQTALVAVTQGQAMWTLANERGMTLLGIDPKEKERLRQIAAPVFKEFATAARPQPAATRMYELLLEAAKR